MNNPFEERNLAVLERMSRYLNANPRLITAQDVREVEACGVSAEEAVRMLFAAACGMEEDRALCEGYLRPSIRVLPAQPFRENPYLQAVAFPEKRLGRWQMTHMRYEPYELFVRDDLLCLEDGREIPRLGCFAEAFTYPAVLQDGREWMTVTPNEMATMQPAIDAAHGDVVAMGLGLGYFAFMAGRKPDVRSVTVVERDGEVIELFSRHILPQLICREKIRIVQADAFAFAADTLPGMGADLAFVDLWHDTLDGAPMYLRMKALEGRSPGTRFMYWIETGIRSFLRGMM